MISFIDLYAGIGGIRFGFEQAGATCVFSSEWNPFAQDTYEALHGERPTGDISSVNFKTDIPAHNILTAGFPCQPFSLAGVSKKNSLGRKHGFEDPTQGTEFFKIKTILKLKKPEAFLLENVKNLKSHDKGRTFEIISQQLDEAGYDFRSFIVDSSKWVPQHRERIYIIGFRKTLNKKKFLDELIFCPPSSRHVELDKVLMKESEVRKKFGHKYTIPEGTWNALKRHKEKHASKGNGFGFGIIEEPIHGQITRTLSARYYKDGAEILIKQRDSQLPRKLLPLEAFRLQGFPASFECLFDGSKPPPCSDSQLYKQLGNSVTVPVIKEFSVIIVNELKKNGIH